MLKQVLSQHDIFTEVVQKILKLSSDTIHDIWWRKGGNFLYRCMVLVSDLWKAGKAILHKMVLFVNELSWVVCMLKLTQLWCCVQFLQYFSAKFFIQGITPVEGWMTSAVVTSFEFQNIASLLFCPLMWCVCKSETI